MVNNKTWWLGTWSAMCFTVKMGRGSGTRPTRGKKKLRFQLSLPLSEPRWLFVKGCQPG